MSRQYELHVGKMGSDEDPDKGINIDWIKEDPMKNYAIFDEVKTGSAKEIIKWLIRNDPLLEDYQLVKKK